MTKTPKNPGALPSFASAVKPRQPAPKPPAGITPSGRQTVCGDIDMRIDRNGLWHYAGSPIGRKELVKLFSTVLRRDHDGDHWLITPVEMCRITVEDAAYLGVELTVSGEGQSQNLELRTNIDEIVTIGEGHPLRIDSDPETGAPAPYVALNRGLEARLARSVFYQLVELGVEHRQNHERLYGVWSGGVFFPLGSMRDVMDGEQDT